MYNRRKRINGYMGDKLKVHRVMQTSSSLIYVKVVKVPLCLVRTQNMNVDRNITDPTAEVCVQAFARSKQRLSAIPLYQGPDVQN